MSNVIVKVQELMDKNKAIAAGLTTFGLAVGAAAERWIATGDIDMTQVRITGGGLAAAVIVGGVTFITKAGRARVALPAPKDVVAASDSVEIQRGARKR